MPYKDPKRKVERQNERRHERDDQKAEEQARKAEDQAREFAERLAAQAAALRAQPGGGTEAEWTRLLDSDPALVDKPLRELPIDFTPNLDDDVPPDPAQKRAHAFNKKIVAAYRNRKRYP